jgi:hypothetical protein
VTVAYGVFERETRRFEARFLVIARKGLICRVVNLADFLLLFGLMPSVKSVFASLPEHFFPRLHGWRGVLAEHEMEKNAPTSGAFFPSFVHSYGRGSDQVNSLSNSLTRTVRSAMSSMLVSTRSLS